MRLSTGSSVFFLSLCCSPSVHLQFVKHSSLFWCSYLLEFSFYGKISFLTLLNISCLNKKILLLESYFPVKTAPVSWGCRIRRLRLCRGVRLPPNKCPGYDTKQSDGEAPVLLELCGMQSAPSLPLLPGPLWARVVAPDMGPIYKSNRTVWHLNWVQMTYGKLNSLK